MTQVARRESGQQIMGQSIRTEPWRYTEWNEGAAGIELYDYEKDPGETRNLAADPKYASKVRFSRSSCAPRP